MSRAASVSYPNVKKIYDRGKIMNWVAFGPDGAYVVDTASKLYSSDRSMLSTYKKDGKTIRAPLRCVSFGPEGAWVAIDVGGGFRSRGLREDVSTALKLKSVRVSTYSELLRILYRLLY